MDIITESPSLNCSEDEVSKSIHNSEHDPSI